MHIEFLQLRLQILRGRIAFHAGVGGEDDLPHPPAGNSRHQLFDLQVVGTNAFDGGQHALQDMILALISVRAFQR